MQSKNTFKRALLMVSAIAGLTAAMIAPQPAQADQQGQPVTQGLCTNIPPIITPAAASNSINSFIPVRQGRGLALQDIFNVSSGTTAPWLLLAPTVDGTNISGNVMQWTLPAANGATAVVGTTNFARGVLDGYIGLFVLTATNGNAGTLTNKGLTYSYPNY